MTKNVEILDWYPNSRLLSGLYGKWSSMKIPPQYMYFLFVSVLFFSNKYRIFNIWKNEKDKESFSQDRDCQNERKLCLCDGLCGMSCIR